jgi:hypothetical protein
MKKEIDIIDTVFILGAGASWHFGFPTGPELREDILHVLLNHPKNSMFDSDSFPFQKTPLQRPSIRANARKFASAVFGTASSPQISSSTIHGMADSLSKAPATTIDQFIEHRQEFLPLAKLAMLSLILGYERFSQLGHDADQNWFHELWAKLYNPDPKWFDKPGRLSFVIFNYDRSLQESMIRAFASLFNIQNDQARKCLEAIEIHHVNMRAGYLAEETKKGDRGKQIIPYGGAGLTAYRIFELSKELRFVFEPTHESIDLKRIKSLIENSSQTISLGFGYDNENIGRIIDLENDRSVKPLVSGSCFNMNRLQVNDVSKATHKLVIPDYQNNSLNCAQYVRQCVSMIERNYDRGLMA